jgi:hypothetical protein
LKQKYKILQGIAKYSVDTQVRIVLALIALHNFVRCLEGIDQDILLEEEDTKEEEVELLAASNNQPLHQGTKGKSAKAIDEFRDHLAKAM